MKKPSENKKLEPVEDKSSAGKPGVTIRFKPGRGATGIQQDENRCARVDPDTAETMIRLGYADAVPEPETPSLSLPEIKGDLE